MHALRFWMTPLAAAAWMQCGAAAWAQCAATPEGGRVAAEIVALAGQGQTRAAGEQPWSVAVLAQQLGAGADVRTLELSSAALLLADRTQIRMSASAQLRLCEAQPARTLLELLAGRLWARTKKTPAALELRTPAVLAVVRGTDWDVEVQASGRTTLTVLSGQVDFSNDHGRVLLGPAEQGIAVPGQAPTKRLLVHPRERVQWVMANPVDVRRWAEFQGDGLEPALSAVRADLDAGNGPQARQRLLALRASGVAGPGVELVLADLAASDAQLEAAVQSLESAWQRMGDPRLAARRAELLLAQDRPDAARAVLDEALARSGGLDSSDLALADGDWYRLAGRGDEALARYRAGVAHAQGPFQQAEALGRLGRALQERGDLASAREVLAQAVALAPGRASLLGLQATVATEALRLQEADAGFNAALVRQGDDYESLAGAGFLALRQGDAEAARRWLLKALVIEPRYARAHVWLAVAEYTLGGQGAALDSLERARQADPKDPLAWQVESMIRNDAGEPEQAIAAAREALVRLPWLKSLNPLASDSQGSANLGKALGDFGMEHWARAYAEQSYYPLWAGSHFFMANRYESDFSRSAELYQGYLADPLAFGARERHAPILLTQGQEAIVAASAERNAVHSNLVATAQVKGTRMSGMPMAWLLRGYGISMQPRDGTGSYWLRSPSFDVAWGARPTDRLGLFLVHNQGRDRSGYPGGLDFGNGYRLDGVTRQQNTSTDIGGAWRWSPDAQTWVKFNHGRYTSARVLDHAVWGPLDARSEDGANNWMLRHVIQFPAQRWSFGWEHGRDNVRLGSRDADIASDIQTQSSFDMPWVAGEWRTGAWTWHAEASVPRLQTNYANLYRDAQTGDDIFPPDAASGGHARKLRPRVGVTYRFGPGRALHAAYIENMRAPAGSTLAPVSIAGIPIDHQYQLPGSLGRKRAVQLDWELDARTFAWGMLSSQDIVNPTFANGSLLLPRSALLEVGDRAGVLGAVTASGQTAIDAYDGDPRFSRGSLHQAGLALNRVLTPHWSVLGSYTWAHARNTSERFLGNGLPGVPRHTAVLANVWRHGGRDTSMVSLVYRGSRFADEANANALAPGWNLNLVHTWETADRRWAFTGVVQTRLHQGADPALWFSVRYRMD